MDEDTTISQSSSTTAMSEAGVGRIGATSEKKASGKVTTTAKNAWKWIARDFNKQVLLPDTMSTDEVSTEESTSQANTHFESLPLPTSDSKVKDWQKSIETAEKNDPTTNETVEITDIPIPNQTDSVMVNTSETLWNHLNYNDDNTEDDENGDSSLDTIFSSSDSSFESEEEYSTSSGSDDSSDLNESPDQHDGMKEVDVDSSWGFYDLDESSFMKLEKKYSFDHLIAPADYKKLHFERRILIGPYKFKIVENESKENSLYRAIAKAVYNKESEWQHVEKIVVKEFKLKWDYYNDIHLKASQANEELNKTPSTPSPFENLFKNFTANSKRELPNVFKDLHAAASYFGFRFTLLETFEEDTKVYPHYCDDKDYSEPRSDVSYYFLMSGEEPNDWQLEFLIPIGVVGLLPHRDYTVKFRNSILVHPEIYPFHRYPLENECIKETEKVKSWYDLCPWSSSKVFPSDPATNTQITQETQKDSLVFLKSYNDDNNQTQTSVRIDQDRQQNVDDLDEYRVPRNRNNIHQVSYHQKMKMDMAVYHRNFMIYKTNSHNLFTLLSEVMFRELKNAPLVRDQIREEIRKSSYIHILSKTRRRETLVGGTPDLNHKNFQVLFSKKPDYGNVRDLDNAAQYFEFSYIVIGCDSNFNFFWKESRTPRENESTPFLAFFVYTYYKSGNVPVKKWYFLSEEQSTLQTYKFYFGGSTMHKLRDWNNQLYVTPQLTKHVQSSFPDNSIWNKCMSKLWFLRKSNTPPTILHYVVPVSSPKSAYLLKLCKKDAEIVDNFITENGAKNEQTQRLTKDGKTYIVKVQDNRLSAWVKLWSLKNKPKYADHIANFSSWALRRTSGLWHSINPSPLISSSSPKALQLLVARLKLFIRDALNSAEFGEEIELSDGLSLRSQLREGSENDGISNKSHISI